MGGRVGLKGTDGEERLSRALELGAKPTASHRAGLALDRLASPACKFSLLTGPGEMGESVARHRGFPISPVGSVTTGNEWSDTTEADTRDAAKSMVEAGAELIMFAGGDGTARAIRDSVGDAVPVLGIPTGVKMHSGCFARNPAAAGDIAADFMKAPRGRAPTDGADVVDRVEGEPGSDPSQVLFGSLNVPREASRLLGSKVGASKRDDAALQGACEEIVERMDPETSYILGPGSTIGRLRGILGIESDPLAVDVVRGRRLVASDVSEAELIGLVARADEAKVILGVVGGQGALLGRGNQQISARVLAHLAPDDVMIVAGLAKLIALDSAPLNVDTGDRAVDRSLAGYRPVRIGRRETLMYQVAT